MPRKNRIVVSRPDFDRLRAIVVARSGWQRNREHLLDFRKELDQARIVSLEEIPADVVTLDSEVRVRNSKTGIARDYNLVCPALADLGAGHVSVLAPLGTALLGHRQGDEVEWQISGGIQWLQIEKVRQPQRIVADYDEHEAQAHPVDLAA